MLGAVNKDTITRGLRYCIATGNWGVQGQTGIRPGVSQVKVPPLHRCAPLARAQEACLCTTFDNALDFCEHVSSGQWS